jgi:hypothetical protein
MTGITDSYQDNVTRGPRVSRAGYNSASAQFWDNREATRNNCLFICIASSAIISTLDMTHTLPVNMLLVDHWFESHISRQQYFYPPPSYIHKP